MERAKYFIIVLLFSSFALNGDHSAEILKHYLAGDMVSWKKTIDRMELQKGQTPEFRLALLNYQYGYIGYCIGAKKDNEARKYLRLAEKNLAYLKNSGYGLSCVSAYQAAFKGYEIGMNRLKAPVLGPQSVEDAKKAIALDTNNPMGFTQYGNILFYMPGILGGSQIQAISYYARAEKLYEKNMAVARNDWNYLNLVVRIAQSYEALGYNGLAKRYYQKALRIHPDFLWVRDELYPSLLKKI